MHKLQKQILNAKYYDEAGVDQFYSRALHIINEDLTPEMERLLDKYNISEQLIKINNLTVNLGLTYETELRNQWINKFKEEFEKELLEKITQLENEHGAPGESIMALYENEVEILLFYLKTGSLPWHSGSSNINIHSLFDRLLTTNPIEIDKGIRAETGNYKLIQRLVVQFSDKQIESLIEVMQPSESTLIIQSAAEIRKTQQRDQIVKTSQKEFRNAIWQFILSYIINNRGSYFNTREYLRALLHDMASHYNIAFGLLIQEIYSSIHQLKMQAIHFQLGNLLQDIYNIEQQGKPTSIESEIQYKQITGFLKSGQADKVPIDRYKKLLLKWMIGSPLTLRHFLHKDADTVIIQRIVELLPEKGIEELLQIIIPSEATFVIHFKEDVSKLQKEENLVTVGSKKFSSDLWVILLDVILNDRGSLFNHKVFVLSALEKLSRHYNLNVTSFLNHIFVLIDELKISEKTIYLFRLFAEIKKDFVVKKRKRPISEKTKTAYYLDSLSKFLKGEEKAEDYEQSEHIVLKKNNIISYLLEKAPKSFVKWVSVNISSEAIAIAFSNDLELSELKKLIDLMSKARGVSLLKFLSLFMALNSLDSSTSKAVNEFEFYQLAFVFLYSFKSTDSVDNKFLVFLINNIASKLEIEENDLALHFIQQVDSNEYRLSEGTKTYLAKAFHLEKATQRKQAEQKSTKEWEPKKEHGLIDDSGPNTEGHHKTRLKKESLSKGSKPGSNVLKKEISKITSLNALNKWFKAKFNVILSNDTEKLHELVSVYFDKRIEKKWTINYLSELEIGEIFKRIGLLEKPFLSGYLTDIEFLFSENYIRLNDINISWLRFQILQFWSQKRDFSQTELSEFLLIKISSKTKKSINVLKELLFEKAKNKSRNLKSTLILDLGRTHFKKSAKPMPDKLIIEEKIMELEKVNKSMEETEIDESDTIYITNAGLVLLNPFIPVLFEKAGLLINREFNSDEKKMRAVQLLQYCVGSSENIEEYLLVLPKILCGIEINEPIEHEFYITDDEQTLIKSLLENIIQQWSILGETKIDGLQQTFLERNGALRLQNERWELEVEKRSFDVLLDKIPWTYTMIKYPWMEKPLHTIWR